jgi:hypothetical protein
MVLPSIVPRLQAKVLSSEIVAANPKVAALLAHPAGPFTGKLRVRYATLFVPIVAVVTTNMCWVVSVRMHFVSALLGADVQMGDLAGEPRGHEALA